MENKQCILTIILRYIITGLFTLSVLLSFVTLSIASLMLAFRNDEQMNYFIYFDRWVIVTLSGFAITFIVYLLYKWKISRNKEVI